MPRKVKFWHTDIQTYRQRYRPSARTRSRWTITREHRSSNSVPSCSYCSFCLSRHANSRSGYIVSSRQCFYTHTHTSVRMSGYPKFCLDSDIKTEPNRTFQTSDRWFSDRNCMQSAVQIKSDKITLLTISVQIKNVLKHD